MCKLLVTVLMTVFLVRYTDNGFPPKVFLTYSVGSGSVISRGSFLLPYTIFT